MDLGVAFIQKEQKSISILGTKERGRKKKRGQDTNPTLEHLKPTTQQRSGYRFHLAKKQHLFSAFGAVQKKPMHTTNADFYTYLYITCINNEAQNKLQTRGGDIKAGNRKSKNVLIAATFNRTLIKLQSSRLEYSEKNHAERPQGRDSNQEPFY